MAYQIDQELCSCCHRCRVECPTGAIRFRGSKYWIDPEQCVCCGHCVTVCHNDVISDPDNPPPAATPHSPEQLKCDVLVIGAGAAGLAAAARAASLGKRVLVLEKNKEIGGSAWYAHVFRSYWSQWHRQAGLKDPREDLYREFMAQTRGQVNGKLVRRILDANEDFVNWLISEHNLGADYTFGPQFWGGYGPQAAYDWDYNHRRIDTTIGPGGTGWYMTRKLLSILLDKGGAIRYRTAAKALLTDDTGAISGALAQDPGGELQISCSQVVVAAGAFSRNKELTGRFNPLFYTEDPDQEPVHVFTCATCTGDGITLCEQLGADIDYVNARAAMLGPMRHPFGTASLAAGMSRYGIQVNRRGEPFLQDCMGEAISPLVHQPGRMLYQIIDRAGVERTMAESLGRPCDVPGADMNPFYQNWEAELEQERQWGVLFSAPTLEALGEQIHIPADRLRQAVDLYNQRAGQPETRMGPNGPEELPPKPPMESGPWYAIPLKLFHENAIGGMVIDENAQVLRLGRPIPGLYAAGDNTRGVMLPGRIGADYIERTISALTFALCSGYIAGEMCGKQQMQQGGIL